MKRDSIEFYIAQKKRHLKSNEKTKRYPSYLGVKCYLTEDDINLLLKEADITWDQVGKGKGKFCLGRHNDSGDYQVGNCSFITHSQNTIQSNNNCSEETREKLRENVVSEELFAPRKYQNVLYQLLREDAGQL
mgnify:CR=1 FL=1